MVTPFSGFICDKGGKEMKAKKAFFALSFVLMGSMLVSACASPGTPTESPQPTQAQAAPTQAQAAPTQAQAAPTEGAVPPVTIVVSSGGFGNNMTVGIAMYKATYPDRQVNMIVMPHDSMYDKLMTQLTTHTGGVDCIPVEIPINLQTMNPFLEPLQPYIDKSPDLNFGQLLPPNIPAARYPYPDGQIYTIPVRQGVDLLHYRSDLFTAAGVQPPTSFEDMVTVAQKLKTPGLYPLTMPLKQGTYGVNSFLDVYHGMGGAGILNKDLKQAALGPTAVKALQWMIDAVYKYQIVNPTDLNSQIEDVFTNMEKGRAAMGVISSGNIYNLDPDIVAKGGSIGYAELPYDAPAAGNGGVYWAYAFGINKDSQNKEGCWDLIKYLASNAPQVQMAIQSGNGPSLGTVFTDPAYLASPFSSAAAATKLATTYALAKDPSPKYNQIVDIFAAEESSALSQKETAQQAIDKDTSAINALLSGS
jgi:ABC-type glycerol-3-phosphate transport system substrate-binding protein